MKVCVTIFLLVCDAVVSQCTYQANLDTRAEEYVKEVEAEAGQTINWWDMYRKHPHLSVRPQYQNYHVTVKALKPVFAAPKANYTGVGWRFSQWFHNDGSEPITTVFEKSTEFTSQYSWTVTKSLIVQGSVDVKVGIPAVFGAAASFSNSFAIDSVATNTTTRTETYSVKNTLTVPPQRSLKVDFVIMEHTVEVPWESEIEFTGYIALWFNDKYKNHWLWFHPVQNMANNEFVLACCGNCLCYKYQGIFNGHRGVGQELIVTEYPLQKDKIKKRQKKDKI